ncbi:plasmid recombination protein, partial [Klebsiella pneumoniae]
MAYAILRVEKTKNTSIAGKNSHNMRLRKTHNADPNLKSQNRILIGSGDLRTDLNARFQATNVKARNSTSVVCNELILTASPEFFENNKKLEDWVKVQMEYLQNEFGENAINAVLHLDEQTPHIHAFITGIEYKNGEYKLNNKSYMKKYETMQDIYFKYNKPLGLIRGVKKEISNAKYKEVKEFYSDIKNIKNQTELEIENNKIEKIRVIETEEKKKIFRDPEVVPK